MSHCLPCVCAQANANTHRGQRATLGIIPQMPPTLFAVLEKVHWPGTHQEGLVWLTRDTPSLSPDPRRPKRLTGQFLLTGVFFHLGPGIKAQSSHVPGKHYTI